VAIKAITQVFIYLFILLKHVTVLLRFTLSKGEGILCNLVSPSNYKTFTKTL